MLGLSAYCVGTNPARQSKSSPRCCNMKKNGSFKVRFRKILTPGHVVNHLGFRMWLDSRLLPYLFQTIGWTTVTVTDTHRYGRRYAKPRYENITEPGMKASHVGSAQPPAPSPSRSARSTLARRGRSLWLSPNQSN